MLMPPISIKHHSTVDSIKYLGTVLVIGGGIGLLVSVVCSLFVASVQWVIDSRNGFFDEILMLPGTELTLMPALWLILAALLLFMVRKVFKIDRWHGPADSIYAAHRTDNELDIKAGIGSTLAAFISLGGGAPVGQYGPLVHFGASIGSHLSVNFGGHVLPENVCVIAPSTTP